MAKRIALVTCSKYPQLTDDDRLLASALHDAGAQVAAVDWRDPSARWEGFDLVLLRSPWDYHLYAAEFSDWVDGVNARTRLINPASLVRWNMDKRYLAELGDRGVPVLPCTAVEAGAEIPVAAIAARGWTDLVVKPLIGASAWQIARTDISNLSSVVTEQLQAGGFLIQPYAREIEEGEYSLVFFNGQFSHAVLKKPAAGDFRSQRELGGTQALVHPDTSIVNMAAAVLESLPDVPLYARLDGVLQDGQFVLMEAELIEPELYFRLQPEAARTLAGILLALG